MTRAAGARASSLPRGPLPEGEAHVHRLNADAELPDERLAEFASWLAPEEIERHARMSFPRVAREYLLTRALVRATLSRYVAGVAPAAWRFSANEHGRPEVSSPALPYPLRFNLSNTFGLIACLVVVGRDAGIDVEDATRPGRTVEIANRFFSDREVAALHALPEEARRDRFFTYWTLKEAYIKARGMGLAIPLGKFSFLLPEDAPTSTETRVGIAIDPTLNDDASSWQFSRARPTERHFLATAIRRGAGAAEVRLRDYEVDLRDSL